MARLRAVRQTKVVRLPIALPQLCDEPLNRLHAALPLRHPRTALTLSLTHAQTHTTHKIYKNTSNTFTFMHTHTHPTQVEDKMTQMAFSLCLSLSLSVSRSLIVRFCYRGNRVEDERRRRGGVRRRGKERSEEK